MGFYWRRMALTYNKITILLTVYLKWSLCSTWDLSLFCLSGSVSWSPLRTPLPNQWLVHWRFYLRPSIFLIHIISLRISFMPLNTKCWWLQNVFTAPNSPAHLGIPYALQTQHVKSMSSFSHLCPSPFQTTPLPVLPILAKGTIIRPLSQVTKAGEPPWNSLLPYPHSQTVLYEGLLISPLKFLKSIPHSS